jgi:alpha-tubulin suppressor-like RCC1 family protein
MANTTGTYTTGLVDGVLGLDLGRFLIEQAYVTGVASFLSPAYFARLAEPSGFAFKSGVTTYNLDDIYVRNDYWREGNLLNWGLNSSGQLGNNGLTSSSSPVQTVSGGIAWKTASCGQSFTGGVKSDGSLWMWGLNSSGQLGDSTITTRSSPVQTISAGKNWWSISCGQSYTAAIKNDGSLWLWGSGTSGQLGDNSATTKSSPVQTVSGGTSWKQVSAGATHCGAIKSDNTLWMWGSNSIGQLGDNTPIQKSSPVQTVSGGTNWKFVSCGSDFTAAIKTDGSLWMWGQGSSGQLGRNTTGSAISPVQTVSGGNNWKWVSCGGAHTAAIKTDGSLWLWGSGTSGQLGDNSATTKSSPVQTVAGGTSWKQVSSGGSGATHCVAIKTDGTLWCWGLNSSGQLGDNTAANKSSPVQTIIGGTAWRECSAGTSHSLALDYNDQPASIIVPAPPPSTPSCWVARLVYGENNPDWMVFRNWMLHESPIWFRNTYLKYGERFADFIKNKPLIKKIVRKAMDLIVKK